jgi:chromosome segregation ATPase
VSELEIEVKLIKNELNSQKKIYGRLDVAIEKLSDVSNSIHRMLAVHEEKLTRQEEAIFEAEQQIENRRTELTAKIDELHSRITTNTKDIMQLVSDQHLKCTADIQKIHDEIRTEVLAVNNRMGVLEKWRHVLIGGSIVVGFILHKFIDFGS